MLIAIHGSHVLSERMTAQRETWIPQVRHAMLSRSWGDGCLHYRWFVERPYISLDVEMLPWDPEPVWIKTGMVSRRTQSHNMKTSALVSYALASGYDYVFKCDDDTYVRPELLLSSGFERYDYSGSCESHNADDVGNYLWAGGGGGYWLSRKAMTARLEGHQSRHPACDTNTGQILAAAGIKPHHDIRYLNAVSDIERANPPADAITLHKCDPDQMRIVHKALYG